MTAPRRAPRPEPAAVADPGPTISRGVRLTPAEIALTERAAAVSHERWSTWAAAALVDAARRQIAEDDVLNGRPRLLTLDDVITYVIDHADVIVDSVDGLIGHLVGDVAALRRAVVAAWADGKSGDLVAACRQHAEMAGETGTPQSRARK